MLQIEYSPKFARDYKALIKKHQKIELLDSVIKLMAQDDRASKRKLKQRHNMHKLLGKWAGSYECHVANVGDWLLVWRVSNGEAYMTRTGTNDEIFRK